MTHRLTIFFILLFSPPFCFTQNTDTAQLYSIFNGLEHQGKASDDSTLLGENSKKVMGLAPQGTGFGPQLIHLLPQQLKGKMLETNQKERQ